MSKGLLSTLLSTPRPQAAISIAGDSIAAVELSVAKGQLSLSVQQVKSLETGAVVPNMMSPNVADQKSVTTALKEVIGSYKRRPTRVSLVLPDIIAKVTLLSFETVPDRETDLAELIRLKVQKSAPFSLNEAQLSYEPCGVDTTKQPQFLVVVVQKSVLREYESICDDVGLQVGCVDLASFNLINMSLYATSEKKGDDWLLVQTANQYRTLAIIRGSQLIFHRTQASEPGNSFDNFIYQAAMYYEDRLGGDGVKHVVFASSSMGNHSDILENVFERSFKSSNTVALEQLGSHISSTIHNAKRIPIDLLDRLAAPIGILLRDRHG